MGNPTLIVVSAFKFGQYDYQRFEIDEYKKYVDVEILDISWFIDSALNKGTYVKKYVGDELISIKTGYGLFKQFLKYRKMKKNHKIVFLSLVQPFNTKTLYYFILLRIFKFTNLDLYNSGCPAIPEKNKMINRLLKYKSQPRYLLILFYSMVSIYLYKILRLYPKYRLVAGDKHYQLFGKPLESKGVTILLGSSNDYILYLIQMHNEKCNLNKKNRIGVLLDGVAPMFGSDAITLRKKEPFTVKAWYSSMTRFLDSVEKETGANIKVAAHPKSNHSSNPSYLGHRDVIYDQTVQLISSADFIIARNSASITWGILYKKPIIFVYSDQLSKDDKFMKSIYYMSNQIGAKPINIDDMNNHSNISRLLTYDSALYNKYINNYLTSRKDRKSNSTVVIEQVFNHNLHK